MSWRDVLGAVAFLGVCFYLSAGTTLAQSASDVEQAIQSRFDRNREFANMTIEISGAVVILAGEAPSISTRAEAIAITRRTGGVDSVVNDVIIPPAESDQAIATELVKVLRAYPHLTIWDHVDGVVNNGVVTLEGMVTPDRNKPQEIGERVAAVPGIQQINVNIEVMSPAAEDDRIRRAIGRRLVAQGDPFERFQSVPNPPIRILVHRGIVVLLGYLPNQADKIVLQREVAQTQGVLRVENHVVVTN